VLAGPEANNGSACPHRTLGLSLFPVHTLTPERAPDDVVAAAPLRQPGVRPGS
jgi:hypothetical protein